MFMNKTIRAGIRIGLCLAVLSLLPVTTGSVSVPQKAYAWWENTATISFEELYSGASSWGLQISPKTQELAGKKVVMEGFMAPPLKPTISFFVLTQVPMSVCPFCASDADWPANIVVVKVPKAVTALPYDSPIKVTGRLEIGSEVDAETGFVSMIRIVADKLEAI